MAKHNQAIGATAILLATAIVAAFPATARAQHSDWLLGSNGLLSAQQTPPGFYYSNVWSYYRASGSDFIQSNSLAYGPLGHLCASLGSHASGSLDLFVDQNVFIWTSSYKILGANYGLLVGIPFALADASGDASLEPILSLGRPPLSGGQIPPGIGGQLNGQASGGTTKGSIADIYVQPIDFGWHFKQADAIVSSSFFAPAGPYNPAATVNIVFGHWTGVFGIGSILCDDPERKRSLSIHAHYLLYESQKGRSYTLGDAVPLEWGAAKTLDLGRKVFKQLILGAVGYAQWQVVGNSVDVAPTTLAGRELEESLENSRPTTYAAGPAFNLLTSYGLFSLVVLR